MGAASSVLSLRQYESFHWGDELDRPFEAQDDVLSGHQSAGASTTRAPSGHAAPPRRAQEPEGAIDPVQDYEYDEEDIPKHSTADAMKAIFDNVPNLDEGDRYLEWNYPQAVHTRGWTPAGDEVEVEVKVEVDTGNPWDEYDVPRWDEPPTKVIIKDGKEWNCPVHGPTCKPGICEARAHVEFIRRKQKKHEELQEAKRKRQEKWKREDERRKRRQAQAEGSEVSPHDTPHFAHRYRGAGGNGSDSEDSSSPSGALTEIERINTLLD